MKIILPKYAENIHEANEAIVLLDFAAAYFI